MLKLLIRLFIKDHENISSPTVRNKYGILCGCYGIAINILLFFGKFLSGSISRSIAITADAFNNLSDAGSSLISILGFKLANKKPDKEHPFGHGRFEYISGLAVSALILMMGFELAKTSIEKIFHPETSQLSLLSGGILVFSIIAKLYMSFYNRRIGDKIGSVSMKATSVDSLSDTIATATALIAAVLSRLTSINFDAYGGILVAIFIIVAGFKAAADTIKPLLGQPPEEEFVKQIEEIVTSSDYVIGIHDLVVHDYGPGRQMISLHAEVSAKENLLSIHDEIDNIERRLNQELNCHATIHMDPIENDDEFTHTTKQQVIDIVRSIDNELTIHDFRVVKGPSHTNLIFDIVVPFGFRLKDSELLCLLDSEIKKLNQNYYTVIEVDKKYTT